MTKKHQVILLLSFLAGVVVIPRLALSADEKTFRGEIADSQCASNVHSLKKSHEEMMAMRHDLKTKADCARFCVRERGGAFVLQSGDKMYHLSNPDQAEPYAGQRVIIVGILDSKTDTITVISIDTSDSDPPNSKHHQ